jgi:SAM-dependent methyltransferase
MKLARMRELFALWKVEKTDPAPFYTELAKDTVADLDRRYGALRGQRIADLGCGPGFYTAAFRAAGADCIPVDASEDELRLAGEPPPGYVLADAGDLPFEDASLDGVFCSNLLEHTGNAPDVIAEIARVLRPGGWGYISWTNWYSPWGGHDMTPYHFLGPERGPRLYEKRHGPPRKNRYGEALFAVHVGPTIRLVASHPGLEIERTEPRYWPRLAFITRVPVLRELVTWNCVIRVRRTASAPAAASTQKDGSAANLNRVVP